MTHSRVKNLLSLLSICWGIALNYAGLGALETPLIPRSVIFGNPEKASPSISPDGTKLGYLAPDDQGVLNVWIRDLTKQDPQAKDQKITADKKRGIRNFLWQYDNDHILYIQDRDGDENWHLYQTSLTTKETRDLTPHEGARADILEYTDQYPDEILVQMNIRNPALFDVYRINLKDGTMVLDTENQNSEIQWLADSKLQVLASQSYTADGGSIIRVRADAKSPWKELLSGGPLESHQDLVTFSKDGKFLYLVLSLNANTGRLVKIDLATKQQEVILEDPNYDVSEVLVNPISYEIDAVNINRDRPEWVALNPDVAADFKVLQQKGAIFKISSQDVKNRKWVVSYVYDNKPSKMYLYDRDTKQKEFLFTPRPKLANYTLSKMTPVSYKARDGMTMHGYLTLPEGKEAKNLPTILDIHGGPHVRDSWGFNPEAQWLANRGYAVLQINYRGSAGYGKNHLNAGNREWGAKMSDDLLDGKAWLISNGYSDPDKVAIYGGSYGGYATLVGLAFTPEAYCCGVDVVGPSNLVTLMKSIPPYWGPYKVRFDLRVGKVETEPEFLESRSPLFKADQIVKPLLIAQGANDQRVKQAESDQIVAAMRKNHKPVEYLLFPDEGHGFVRPENQFKFYAAMEQFLGQYLGGRVEPPSPAENWDSLKR